MIVKCTSCHHEWQGSGLRPSQCDWCGAPGKKIGSDWTDNPGFLAKSIDKLIKEERKGKRWKG